MPELGAATSTQHTQPLQSYSGNCRVGQQGWLLNPCQIDLVLLFLILLTRGHPSSKTPSSPTKTTAKHLLGTTPLTPQAVSSASDITLRQGQSPLWCIFMHGSVASSYCVLFDIWQNCKVSALPILLHYWLNTSCHSCAICAEDGVCNH